LKFGFSDSLSEITLLFDLNLYLDRSLAQQKAKSKGSDPLCLVNASMSAIDLLNIACLTMLVHCVDK